MEVTHGQSDETLASILIDNSRPTMPGCASNGMRFVPMYGRQSFQVDGKHHFYGGVNIEAVGGGAGLVEFLLKRCGEARRRDPLWHRRGQAAAEPTTGRVTGVTRPQPGTATRTSRAKAVVLACGGFESNPEMRVRYLGPGWDLCRVRGTRHNMGEGILAALRDRRASRSATGRAATPASGTSPRRPMATAGCSTTSRSTPIRSASWSTSTASASSTRASDYRNLTYAKFGNAIMGQPQPRRDPDLRPADRAPCCATSTASRR